VGGATTNAIKTTSCWTCIHCNRQEMETSPSWRFQFAHENAHSWRRCCNLSKPKLEVTLYIDKSWFLANCYVGCVIFSNRVFLWDRGYSPTDNLPV
jgi:hypothetical protein